MQKQRYLITGATGFIGSCLTRELVERGQYVSIISRRREINHRLIDIASKLDIHVVNLLSPSLMDVVSKIKPTIIYHLATYGASRTENNVNTMIDTNIRGTLNLINAVKQSNFSLFVNTGSSSEYGIKNEPMQETDTPKPINDYAVTKVAVTLFCQKIAFTEKLPIITLRLFSPYGYYQPKDWFIPSAITNMLKNKPLKLSSPTNVRDFIFVDDVTTAYLKAVGKKFPLSTVINIGSGKEHQIKDVISIAMKFMKSKSTIHWHTQKEEDRQIEPSHWRADISRARFLLGWEPQYSLESGLKKTVRYIKNNLHYYE